MISRIFFSASIVIFSLCGCAHDSGPLSVEDNQPPLMPYNPLPLNGEKGIWTSPTISWSCSDPDFDAITFDVFLDTVGNPRTAASKGLTVAILKLTGLLTNTSYYWRVTVQDYEDTTNGPLWSFTTGSGVNHPPIAPTNPKPEDTAVEISTSPTLSWNCVDPDGE